MPPIDLVRRNPSTGPLERAQRGLQRSLSQLSSARRIDRAGDGAADLAISEQLRARERSLQQGVRNLSDGVSALRTAEGGLSQSAEIVGRLRELSVQAQNSTVSEQGQAAIQNEFDQLTEELTRIAESTRFGDQQLLNGDASGAGAVRVRDGTQGGSDVEVSIDDSTASGLNIEGLQASDGTTLDRLDQALTSISSTRGELGAAESRLRSGVSNLRTSAESAEAARSRIQDTDVAAAAAERTRNDILLRGGVAAQAQANVSAGLALSLLS